MIFLDRLTGGKLSRLPDALLPGRYCLLEPLVVNGHSRLQPGDLLSDDGSGRIKSQSGFLHIKRDTVEIVLNFFGSGKTVKEGSFFRTQCQSMFTHHL